MRAPLGWVFGPSAALALLVAWTIPATAGAQTSTSTLTTTSSVAAAPAAPPSVRLADPVGIPVEPAAQTKSWIDELRYEFVLLSTMRWQQDNGDITELGDNNWDPSGEDLGDIVTTFGGSVGYREWLLAVRFDSAFYVHEPVAHPTASQLVQNQLQDRYVSQFRPEYIALSYNGRDVSATLGDFYMTLGRGMILSIRKVGDVGIDNKLTGALVNTRHKLPVGELSLTEFGGWLNIKNYEAGTGFYYPERLGSSEGRRFDAFDFVTGGRIEYRLGKYLKVGAHAAHIDTSVGSAVNGVAANVELPRPVKWLSAYVEVARISRDDLADAQEVGHGAYANANLYFGKATVLLEGKYYDNMFNVFPTGIRQPFRQVLNRLIEPPTVERPQTLLLANNYIYGGRARVDYRVQPWLVPYAAGGLYWDESFSFQPDRTPLDTPPRLIYAVYGGGRLMKSWSELTFEAGYRTQLNQFSEERKAASQQDRDLHGTPFRDDAHVLLDWRFPVWGPLSMEVAVNYLYARQENGNLDCTAVEANPDPEIWNPEDFDACAGRGDKVYVPVLVGWHEGRVALSVISKDGFSVTGAYEFYTRQPDTFKQHYFSIGGQYEFMEGGIVRALYGGERAGLKCSGGVCRFFPGFEGGRIELNMRL